MAAGKTRLTELGTAVGIFHDPTAPWPESLERLEVPGIPAEVWRPEVLPATAVGSTSKDLLLTALANGQAFRAHVLGGRRPDRIEWTGATRSVWTSDIPRDLTVDGVWFVQTKYDSHCVLNTSPGALVDELLVDHTMESRLSWFEEVALQQLQVFYDQARAHLPLSELPRDVRDLDRPAKAQLKESMRSRTPSPSEEHAYAELCRAVSLETTLRWRHRIEASSLAQRTQMLFRMLRIAGGPYWLLGTRGHQPVRLRVTDTRNWRERYQLKRFTVTDAHAGQPQVNWRAEVAERGSGRRQAVEGYCEIRWSHGKLQGHPECKVQVSTPPDVLPGYDPM